MEYKVLNKQVFTSGNYTLVPIRFEDRYDIMQWRNEQIYHLRQDKPLTKEIQDAYFENVVAKLFEQDQPNQILFSFLENGNSIGYGGLVHIDWISHNAEISFLLNTTLIDPNSYRLKFMMYLELINQVSISIRLHKIYTYGYDYIDYRFEPLYKSGYELEAFLHEHVLFDGELVPVRIYSKFLKK